VVTASYVSTNGYQTATGTVTTVVGTTPTVTTQPADATVTTGDTATFTTAATGDPAPTVQWQLSTDDTTWNNVTGATATTLTVPDTTLAMNGNQYRAVFTNTFGGTGHTASSDPATLTVTAPPVFTSDTPPLVAVVGTPYNYTFTASGAPAPTFALASGSLPPGLTLDPASGVLDGTPTTAGRFTFTVTANNGTGTGTAATTTPIVVTVHPALAVTTASLPDGVVGQRYSTTLTTFGGDGAPNVWTLAPGSGLPSGLSLSRDGVITGTPTVAGTTQFTVSVNDPATAQLSITVVPAPAAPTATTATTPLAQTGPSLDPITITELALLMLLAGAFTLGLGRRRGDHRR
jgi:hypothetical protein